MHIRQKTPSVSGQERKAREATPTAPSQSAHPTAPATTQPAAPPRKAGGEARFQSNFGAPVRRNASAKRKNFVTPPPPGHASAQASAMGDDELRQALDAAHELIHGGRKASGAQVNDWMERARQLASEHGNNFNGVKYALHAEMLSGTLGASAPTSKENHTLGDSELRKALDEAHKLVHASKASGPRAEALMVRARQLASEGKGYNDIKYTLHAELLSEKTGQKYMHGQPSGANAYAQTALNSQILKSKLSPDLFSSGTSIGDSLAYAANNHAKQLMQNQLFGKLATIKASEPPAPMSNATLRRAVDDVHQLVFGMKASGTSADDLMAQAKRLASEYHNNLKAIQFALHALMIDLPSPPSNETPAEVSKEKSLPVTAAGLPPPSNQELHEAVDAVHQAVFKQEANGPHVNAWIAEARKLADMHDNNLDTVKYLLHSQMLELK